MSGAQLLMANDDFLGLMSGPPAKGTNPKRERLFGGILVTLIILAYLI
jgi:hypothetical protein